IYDFVVVVVHQSQGGGGGGDQDSEPGLRVVDARCNMGPTDQLGGIPRYAAVRDRWTVDRRWRRSSMSLPRGSGAPGTAPVRKGEGATHRRRWHQGVEKRPPTDRRVP